MSGEEKQLLLIDLCGRLVYDVKGRVYAETTNGDYDMEGEMIFFDSPFDVTLDDINTSTEEIHVIAIGNEDTVNFIEDQQINGKPYTIDEFKPYLRPMSKMTIDEKIEWFQMTQKHCDMSGFNELLEMVDFTSESLDWLNKKGLDYRGLIPMGLALEAPKDMYK